MGSEPRPVIRRSTASLSRRRRTIPPIVVQLVRADGFREAAAQPEFADEAMIFAAVALSLAGVPARRILAGPLEFRAPIDLTNRHAVIGTTVPGATYAFRLRRLYGASLVRCGPDRAVSARARRSNFQKRTTQTTPSCRRRRQDRQCAANRESQGRGPESALSLHSLQPFGR